MRGLGDKQRRAWFAIIVLWLAGLSLDVLAAEGGLVIGFLGGADGVERTSLTAMAETPEPKRAKAGHWRMQADTDAGQMLWQWSLPDVQRFHLPADERSAFLLVVPAIDPGTRLSLRDQRGRLLWSEQFDAESLRAADQRGVEVSARLQAATMATARLAAHSPDDRLTRQLSGLDHERFALAKESSALLEARLASASEPSSPIVNPSIDAVLDLPRSRASVVIQAGDSTPPDRGDAPAGDVPILVLDENGQPPGAQFHLNLFGDGTSLGSYPVDADGRAQLPLVSGGQYQLHFFPQVPLVAERIDFLYSGQALPTFQLEIGWLFEVQLRDTDDQPIAGPNTGHVISNRDGESRWFPLSMTAMPGQLRVGLPRDESWQHYLSVTPLSDDYPEMSMELGALNGPQSRVLNPPANSPIAGLVRALDGGSLPGGGWVTCFNMTAIDGVYYRSSASFAADGGFVLHWPLGIASFCSAYVESPMLGTGFERRFRAGESMTINVLRGVPVRFRFVDDEGPAMADSAQGNWTDRASGTNGSCYGNPCDLLVPNDRAVAMAFRFASGTYAPIDLPARQYAADSEQVVILTRIHSVSGRVLNTDVIEEFSVRVRVYDDNERFLVSSRGSNFSFDLPAGRYRFEADANLPWDHPWLQWLYRPTVSSAWVQLDADTQLPDLALPDVRATLELVVDRPCGFDDRAIRLVYLAPDGRRLDTMHRQRDELPDLPRPPGQCASVHTIGLPPGAHAIDVAPLGWPLRRIDVSLAAGQVAERALVFTATERTEIWRGQLRDVNQQPVTRAGIWLDNAEQMTVANASINAQGQFELPFVPGWGAKVWIFDGDTTRALSQTIRYAQTPPGPNLVLDRINLTAIPDHGLLRVYGDGDRRKRNIVFVAEGYADVAETYTDVNGNGRWDGVVWYDLNGSGVFEWAGDRLGFYGEAAAPQEGTIPTLLNEPFVDLNGDGVLSVDDPGLFKENVFAFMRSLLGSDVWSEHRGHFNAWILFAPSAQAGHDVRDVDGDLQLTRDTRYGAYLDLNGSILHADTSAMLEEVLTAVPEIDLLVAMLNEPIYGGRANATTGDPGYIVFTGGVLNNDSNNTTQSHEMGHFVAALCDEYEGYAGFHWLTGSTSDDLECANASVRVDPEQIPWREHLAERDAPSPTLHRDGSLGVYEGASYYSNGAYRPSRDSTMRINRPFFNLPSRLAIETAIHEHAIAAETIFMSGFE